MYKNTHSCICSLKYGTWVLLAIWVVVSSGCVSPNPDQGGLSAPITDSVTRPWLRHTAGIYKASDHNGRLLESCLSYHPEVRSFVNRNGEPSHIVSAGFGRPFWLVYYSRKVCVRWSRGTSRMQTMLEMKADYARLKKGEIISLEPSYPNLDDDPNWHENKAFEQLDLIVQNSGESLERKVQTFQKAVWYICGGLEQRIQAGSARFTSEHTRLLMETALSHVGLLLDWENAVVDDMSSVRNELSTLAWFRISIPQYVRALDNIPEKLKEIEARVGLKRTLVGARAAEQMKTELQNDLCDDINGILRRE